MDDDVKNLFQRFGQSTDGYQEINRQTDSDQARQRWPLLRDVRLHPSSVPVRAEHQQDSSAPQRALAERQEVSLNQVSAPVRQSMESEPAQVFSLKEASSRQVESTSLFEAKVPAQGLFSERSATVNVPPAQARSIFSSAIPASIATPASPAMPIHPAHSATPAAPAAMSKQSVESVTPVHGVGFLGGSGNQFNPVSRTIEATPPDVDNKNHSIGSVFNRLAGKTEQAKPAESSVNSFFKKIFKP